MYSNLCLSFRETVPLNVKKQVNLYSMSSKNWNPNRQSFGHFLWKANTGQNRFDPHWWTHMHFPKFIDSSCLFKIHLRRSSSLEAIVLKELFHLLQIIALDEESGCSLADCRYNFCQHQDLDYYRLYGTYYQVCISLLVKKIRKFGMMRTHM